MPSFDPNTFSDGISRARVENVVERTITIRSSARSPRAYPSGSTIKPSMALQPLLNAGINREEHVFCSGHYAVGNHVFGCWIGVTAR